MTARRARPGARRKPAARPPRGRRRVWAAAALLAVLALASALLLARGPGVPAFDGERALAHVRRQVAFGPRIPGTAGHARQLDWMEDTLRPLADTVLRQPFVWTDPQDSTRTLAGTNLVASFAVGEGQRAVLAAHFDTRPAADRDPVPARRGLPVPGANDGGSGVAVLVELARHLARRPPDGVGVDLAFFDLEDLGTDGDAPGPATPFAIGSEAFVAQNAGYRPAWGVLLDMVCDRALQIPREAYSQQHAPRVTERVWAAARRAGAAAFLDRAGGAVVDDHLAFLRAGIPMVDLIHQPFPATWHTTGDLPEACSAGSLGQVGQTLLELLYGEPSA
jgi:glutaminyl-peptide cyclotransferase